VKVAVLRGGKSAEREVSLLSGAQVEKALRKRGHDVSGVDIDLNTWDVLRDGAFDCVFNALHGRLGEDGTVQACSSCWDSRTQAPGSWRPRCAWTRRVRTR